MIRPLCDSGYKNNDVDKSIMKNSMEVGLSFLFVRKIGLRINISRFNKIKVPYFRRKRHSLLVMTKIVVDVYCIIIYNYFVKLN